MEKSIAPKAMETAYRGWPTRHLDDDGPVVAVAGYSRYAAVFFFRARDLDDPDGLLVGTRTKMSSLRPLSRPRSAPP